MATPSIMSLEAFLDAVDDTLTISDALSPFSLILGAGFSHGVIPSSQEVIDRIPSWLGKDSSEFWPNVNKRLPEGQKLTLTKGDLPDLSNGDSLNSAYSAGMLYGLKSPAIRRQFYRHICDERRGQLNLAHLYLASILDAQGRGEAIWNYNARFCTTIFTTNFDPLLQVALQLMSKLYYMTDRPRTLEIPHDSEHDAIHLVYTHGSIHQAYLANTHEEINECAEAQAERLPDYLQRHGIIVIGYGGWIDACMRALEKCSQFAHNVYWCDRHPANQIDKQLRTNVYKFLCDHPGNAFYVQINEAGELMQRLHEKLGLGLIPSVIKNPLMAIRERLDLIKV